MYSSLPSERTIETTILNIPGLMGIAVTDGGTVFLSSSKEHALLSLKEEEMVGGTETLTLKSVWRNCRPS